MNQSLKSKRDELAVRPKHGQDGTTRYYSEEFQAGFDAAIQAVIELLGEFNKAAAIDQAKHEDSDGYFGFLTGSEWQHEQILNKLRGES
jgi:hypothetical protein